MKKNKRRIIVNKCKSDCPFFKKRMNLMYCDHPDLRDKHIFIKSIINNIDKNYIPIRCPLRNGDVKEILTIGLNK
jgi:hypothetical protein